jgi:hypothetical protein
MQGKTIHASVSIIGNPSQIVNSSQKTVWDAIVLASFPHYE